MAGHSKWANIKHRKERVDSKRGKAFSQVVKEITVAVRLGGGDPNSNPRLRLALQKGREVNLPNDNVDKAIKRGTGQLETVNYEEIRYEGYGPAGTAIIVEGVTDNRNRTLSEVRMAFGKNGGNLASEGAVIYMFERIGQILFAPSCEQGKIEEVAIEAGASDLTTETDGSMEIITPPEEFHAIFAEFEKAGLIPDAAELTMRPITLAEIPEKSTEKVRKLLTALEDCEDIQQIYTNAQFTE